MPKMKTHKASKRRMRLTNNKKVVRTKTNVRHLLTHRTPKQKRQNRRKAVMTDKTWVDRLKYMHPYD